MFRTISFVVGGLAVLGASFWVTLVLLEYWDEAGKGQTAATAPRVETAASPSKPVQSQPSLSNLIVNAASLDTTASKSAASFQRTSAPGAPVNEYKLAAEGPNGEHYIVLGGISIPAGLHTLAMQVRAAGTTGMRLQFYDERNNAVIADFDLESQKSVRQIIGSVERADATIGDANAQWRNITLTAVQSGGNARVFIQLRDAKGSTSFTPAGEAILIRNVRLVRGASAP